MSTFEENYKKALAATSGQSSNNYYLAEAESSGLYHIYAADPNAKQIFFGWGSDKHGEMWRYGAPAKTKVVVRGFRSSNFDYQTWRWTCSKPEAKQMLSDLRSQPPEKNEKEQYKELAALLSMISQGKTVTKNGWPLHVKSNFPQKNKSSTAHDEEILKGMSRLAWAEHWMREEGEKEDGTNLSGVDGYDAAPDTPKEAKEWAKKAASAIIKANNNASLTQLYQIAKEAGFPNDPENFGADIGHQAIGTGINWTDRIRGGSKIEIKVPSNEFYY